MTKITKQNYDMYRDAVITAVWEVWTGNGRGMDEFTREQTGKSAAAAVNNTWVAGMDIDEWQRAALAELGHREPA